MSGIELDAESKLSSTNKLETTNNVTIVYLGCTNFITDEKRSSTPHLIVDLAALFSDDETYDVTDCRPTWRETNNDVKVPPDENGDFSQYLT